MYVSLIPVTGMSKAGFSRDDALQVVFQFISGRPSPENVMVFMNKVGWLFLGWGSGYDILTFVV